LNGSSGIIFPDSHRAGISPSGISKSEGSRIFAGNDLQIQTLQNRPLEEQGFTYLYLDATSLLGRLSGSPGVTSFMKVTAGTWSVKRC
jgi:transposase-like protein